MLIRMAKIRKVEMREVECWQNLKRQKSRKPRAQVRGPHGRWGWLPPHPDGSELVSLLENRGDTIAFLELL